MLDSRQGWLAHPHTLPRPLRSWLSDRGSLTQRLQSRCAGFRVEPLGTGLARPNPDEYALLGLPGDASAYIRDVLLVCDDVPVVFAHSVLPYASLRGAWNGISRLGSRPLGETLFNNRRIHRQPLAFRHLRRGHPLFDALAKRRVPTADALWARRSVFCLHGRPLLVTEVFLPEIDAL